MFDFRELFILDIANNHDGDVNHGLRIIREHGSVLKSSGVRAAFKFQFRDLDTFFHKDAVSDSENSYVRRFESTRLSDDSFRVLVDEVRKSGFETMCTPFDEPSVKKIVNMGFDIVKVASASARDWPLLEEVASTGLPVVCSTGGLSLDEISDLVSFFEHRGVDFAIMHCVSIYPTPLELCHLEQISELRERFPGISVGWSTHEPPESLVPVQLALALGATLFERHVGVADKPKVLNGYSSSPGQIANWLQSYSEAKSILGSRERASHPEEQKALSSLKRGVFSKREISPGEMLGEDDVYFAFPMGPGQLESGKWRAGCESKSGMHPDEPVLIEELEFPENSENATLKDAIHEIKVLLNKAGVPLPLEFDVEFSHHFGKEQFRSYGATLINVINRQYCKKTIVVLPGQVHPAHFHRLKEESFHVLWGRLDLTLGGKRMVVGPGEIVTVQPGVWHEFSSVQGCVFDEISTHHDLGDSVYRDPRIASSSPEKRKTRVSNWGRFQIL